jgi:hypothetical protein
MSMRRRSSPYSQIEQVQSSRSEVWSLVLLTVALGFFLGLFTDGLSGWLQEHMRPVVWNGVLIASGLLTLALAGGATLLFYGRTESRVARIALWLPYHFPTASQITIARATSYQPPRHARRAFARRYRGREATQRLLDAWDTAQAQGQRFQYFIQEDHLALAQCLALYVLHRYGHEALGAKAPYSWWQVPLKPRRVTMDELPSPLRDNPFLRADQDPDAWRLLLPEGVRFQIVGTTWVLRHRRYGRVTLRWFSDLSVAGPHSQPYETLMTRSRLAKGAKVYAVGNRIEASARIRGALLPASEPFHTWAAGLLARLEEALDLGYYLAQRPARVIRDLEWKIGWVPEGTSLVEMLQGIEARLEALEMNAALEMLDAPEEEAGAGADLVA